MLGISYSNQLKPINHNAENKSIIKDNNLNTKRYKPLPFFTSIFRICLSSNENVKIFNSFEKKFYKIFSVEYYMTIKRNMKILMKMVLEDYQLCIIKYLYDESLDK